MPFTPPPVQPSFDRLKAQLRTSGLEQSNNALFQVINQLIDNLTKFQRITSAGGSSSGANSVATFVTESDETGTLPNSRQLLGGRATSLDNTTPGELTINEDEFVTVEVARFLDGPLTDGDLINPELIFADGETISTSYIATELVFAGGQLLRTP